MVKLKWGMEYKGTLMSVDSYMNVQVTAGLYHGSWAPFFKIFNANRIERPSLLSFSLKAGRGRGIHRRRLRRKARRDLDPM